jgi:hypothetical protein
MTDYPITPPPELINQWWDEAHQTAKYDEPIGLLVATRSAQWGADQELEACCEWVEKTVPSWAPHTLNEQLRTARRPKPPSLKEQALEALRHAPGPDYPNPITLLTADEHALIRRALEALPDD